MKKIAPDPESLRDILSVGEDGKLYWKPRPRESFKSQRAFTSWDKNMVGREAFTSISRGYKIGQACGCLLLAHRVVWAITYGKWPERHLDHINGIRDDNRISNLREADERLNSRNIGIPSNNSTGHIGVTRAERKGAYIAQIKINKRNIYLGTFESIEDAVNARSDANRKYGFHPNHGQRKGFSVK